MLTEEKLVRATSIIKEAAEALSAKDTAKVLACWTQASEDKEIFFYLYCRYKILACKVSEYITSHNEESRRILSLRGKDTDAK